MYLAVLGGAADLDKDSAFSHFYASRKGEKDKGKGGAGGGGENGRQAGLRQEILSDRSDYLT